MAGKYGKKNKVSRVLTNYNLAILGLPGIGKTTLMKNVSEKLAGEDGYIILNMGKEDGVSCIDGVVYENIENWKKFEDVTKDIVKNKETDYPELKIVIIDTIDQLYDIAEPEVIRRYNQEKMGEKNFRPVKTINSAYGGFGAGLDMCNKIVLDKIWELKQVGVSVWICGHTKTKDIIDPYTDQSYSTVSSNLSQKYFNAITTKMHLTGMAVVDRTITEESTGRKNIVTGQEITKNKIVDERRKIVFRDDNFSVDSKSRFRYIVNEIPLDADALINAMQDAIDKEIASRLSTSMKKDKSDSIPALEPEPVIEEEESEPPFPMNDPEEEPEEIDIEEDLDSDEDTRTDDELREEIKEKNREADAEKKKEIKAAIIERGGKLINLDREKLLEVLELF